jgi:hypothetical protein
MQTSPWPEHFKCEYCDFRIPQHDYPMSPSQAPPLFLYVIHLKEAHQDLLANNQQKENRDYPRAS